MEQAVSGHGVFIYSAQATVERYGSASLVAKALGELDMQHAWVRIHGATSVHHPTPTLPLVQALQDAGIAVAGWGWCQGNNVDVEVELALTALNDFGLDHYVADIEEGVNNAHWTTTEVKKFLTQLRASLPDESQVGVSSFGFIPWHKPELMKAANDLVDFFAPQVYWFFHPTTKVLNAMGVSASDYPLDDAASYARLCIKAWRKYVTKPLVLTGQAYWGETPSYTRGEAEAKVEEFLAGFDKWNQLQGFNWWHAGGAGQDAMSFAMYEAIRAARLNHKF